MKLLVAFGFRETCWENDLNIEQRLYDPNKEYDENVNLYFSTVNNLGQMYINTEIKNNNTVHFVYKGETGQKINLAGNFCNWDPWIYELQETSPGLYELQLPLVDLATLDELRAYLHLVLLFLHLHRTRR